MGWLPDRRSAFLSQAERVTFCAQQNTIYYVLGSNIQEGS
jgi:hypothetical protein